MAARHLAEKEAAELQAQLDNKDQQTGQKDDEWVQQEERYTELVKVRVATTAAGVCRASFSARVCCLQSLEDQIKERAAEAEVHAVAHAEVVHQLSEANSRVSRFATQRCRGRPGANSCARAFAVL